ncbi:MAG: hypothetical protein K2Y37_00775 [Pirellulales bacterium]|nr:hypothetical protein [Pirellulales bacterium]
MSSSDLHLDEQTYALAQRLANQQKISVEQLVSQAIEQYASGPRRDESPREGMIGLFADIPELMDQIVEEAYQNRERTPLRLPTT